MKSKKQMISLLLLILLTISLLCPRVSCFPRLWGLQVQELSLVDLSAQATPKEAPAP